MIVLDTSVISEWLRPYPSPTVTGWSESMVGQPVHTTAVTVGELRYGVDRLPDGRRKRELAETVDSVLTRIGRDNVVPFDRGAAEMLGVILVTREHMGRPIDLADAQIAAICRSTGATLATRNTADFEGLGLTLINPWGWTAD